MSDKQILLACREGDDTREWSPHQESEVGISLAGIPDNKKTHQLFEAAQLTGDSFTLSQSDALAETKREVPLKKEKMGTKALKQRAERFFDNASKIIEKIRRQQTLTQPAFREPCSSPDDYGEEIPNACDRGK